MRRALLALVALGLIAATGVALATPVPVLAVSNGQREQLGYLPDGFEISYSYRQSIYGVLVSEDFVRRGDRLELRRVAADADIRAIEYFRWDTQITHVNGVYETVPPTTIVGELTIRVTQAGEQRLRAGDWRWSLLQRFGEGVVRARPERPPLIAALLRGLER